MILMRGCLSGVLSAVFLLLVSTGRLGFHNPASLNLIFVGPGLIFGLLVLAPEIRGQGFTPWKKRIILILASTLVYVLITLAGLTMLVVWHQHFALIHGSAAAIGAGLMAGTWQLSTGLRVDS